MYQNEGPVTNVQGDVRGDVSNTWIKAANLHQNYAIAVPVSDPINFGVCEPVINFTGRLEELTKLEKFFIQGPHSSATRRDIIVVSGLGGIGKTQLVRKFIDLKREMYENVVWIDAESKELIVDSLKTLAKRTLSAQRISALLPNELKELKDLKALIEEVLDRLCQQNTLLIYDNVEQIEDIKFLLTLRPSGKRPNVLITSRIQDFDDAIDVIQLKQWPPNEANEYVSKALANGGDSSSDIELLAEKLQYFPLALRQGTSYIVRRRKTKDFSIPDYVAKCYTQQMLNSNVFQKNSTNLYDRTTFTTWSITIEAIEQEEECGQLAVTVLYLMAYFVPDNIQRDFFSSLNDEYGNRGDVDFDEHLELAVSLLINYSMIDGQDRQRVLSIHRLVQEVIKLKLTETNQASQILRMALQCIGKHIDGVNARTIHPHAISVFVFALDFADLVVEFKTLPSKILESTMDIGKYQQAKEFGDKISEPLANILKEDDVLLAIKYEISVSYFRQGHYNEALQMNKEILDKQKTILGDDHPDTLATRNSIALINSTLGNVSDALQMYEEVLDKQKTVLGEMHSDTLITASNLANSYNKIGNYLQALQLYQEVFDKQKSSLGEDHPATLISGNGVARSYNLLGRYTEALELSQQILDKQKSRLGEEHPNTLQTRSNVAFLCDRLGNYSDALQMYEEIFDKRKTTLGEDHPETLIIKSHIANSFHRLGNYSKALRCHQQVLDKQVTILGEDHPDTLISRSHLANSHNKLGNSSDALQLYQQVFDKRKTSLGEDHPATLRTKSGVANSLNELGKHTEALQLYQEIFDKRKTILGEDHPETLETRSCIARSYSQLGNFSDALQLYHQVFDRRKTRLGEDHPDTLETRSGIAHSLNELGKSIEALQLYQQVYDKRKSTLGEEHPDTLEASFNISALNTQLERLAVKKVKLGSDQ